MSKTILGNSKNGIAVYDASSIGGHVHQTIAHIIAEVIGKVELTGTFVRTTIDMGRIIGKDHLVCTDDSAEIVMWRRPTGNGTLRAGESRMVMNMEAEDTSMVTIILCVAHEGDFNGDWVVVTAFEGKQGEREPWDASLKTDEQKRAAADFWACHALVPTDEERKLIERR